MGHPLVASDRFLKSRLDASTALNVTANVGGRIYGHTVPEGAIYPLVLFTLAGNADNRETVEGFILWSEMVYAVRIIDEVESFAPLEVGAAAIRAALHRVEGTNVSGEIIQCLEQSPYQLIEIRPDGSEVRSLGGIYRPYVQ